MKAALLLGGLFIGGSFGLMVGGALVKVRTDGSETRDYPVVICMALAVAGVGFAKRGWSQPAEPNPESDGPRG